MGRRLVTCKACGHEFLSSSQKPRCSRCGSRSISASPRKTEDVKGAEEELTIKELLDEDFKETKERFAKATLDYAFRCALTDLEDSRRIEAGRIFLRPEAIWFYNYVKRTFKQKAGKDLSLEEFINSVIVEHCTDCLKIRPPLVFNDHAVG